MRFSKRTNWDTEESELARMHRQRVLAGLSIADLTASNPTRCGFDYPAELLSALTDLTALDYDPNPRGRLEAREAICRYYRSHGVGVDPRQIILTTSTSEAYSYLFKLLCDPGDEILVPQPCYPLFDFLADAEVVRVTYTDFVYDHGWQLDFESLRKRITPASRAIVLVHPNNPTGHFTKTAETRELAMLCREHGLALIVDEVFLDYRFGMETTRADGDFGSFAGRDLEVLTFVVSGISKVAGLPQMKAAWLVALGPGAEPALTRLEVIADTFLSMNAPVQCALPQWLDGREHLQGQIRARTAENLAELDRALGSQAEDRSWVSRLQVEGGWYAILRIPATQPDERTARDLLDAGVNIHPGYFFGLPRSGWLVLSLLSLPAEFSLGIACLLSRIEENQKSYHMGGIAEVKLK